MVPTTRTEAVPTRHLALVSLPLAFLGCSNAGPTGTGSDVGNPNPQPSALDCSIPRDDIFDAGVSRGGIPALTDPKLVDAGHPEADYLLDSDRVIGIRRGGQWIAVPHNILWWHEIVNLSAGVGRRTAITYCPLTGSNLHIDLRASGVSGFLVSGLLFRNNLMMLDLETESLWPQMSLAARCGSRDGASLSALPSIEMTWEAWRELHPDTKVVSGVTGFSRDYTQYPYGLYEEPNSPPFQPVDQVDRRRSSKERVLGIPAGEKGLAFPFFALAEAGSLAVIHASTPEAGDVVVFWRSQAQAAAAYEPVLDGRRLRFEVRNGQIVDVETESVWRVDGLAVAGPMAGSSLEPVEEAHVAFWFAWAAFHPETSLWTPER